MKWSDRTPRPTLEPAALDRLLAALDQSQTDLNRFLADLRAVAGRTAAVSCLECYRDGGCPEHSQPADGGSRADRPLLGLEDER